MTPPKSHTQLLRLFRRFNTKYFCGTLPEPLIYYTHIEGGACYGTCDWDGERFVICIDPQWASKRAFRHFTVLHEMVHIKQWSHGITHGKRFHAEMLRLAQNGAFKEIW